MQLYAYRNTEAGARFDLTPRDKPVNIIELKKYRLQQDAIERARRAAAQAQVFEDRRKQANEAIARANEALRIFNSKGRSIDQIILRICRALKVSRSEIMSDRRNHDIALARQAIYYWACRTTALSLPEIGKRLGRDHTTVLYGKRKYPAVRAAKGRYLREVR